MLAQRSPTIAFEDVPLDEARRMSCGPRLNLELYNTFKRNIQSLENTATRMPLLERISPTKVQNRILPLAAELGIPVSIRRVSGGLLFWHVTDEDLKPAKEGASRRQTARRKRPRVRRRRT
jgi:hypothetical protein